MSSPKLNSDKKRSIIEAKIGQKHPDRISVLEFHPYKELTAQTVHLIQSYPYFQRIMRCPYTTRLGLKSGLQKGQKPGLDYFPRIMWAALKTTTRDITRKKGLYSHCEHSNTTARKKGIGEKG